MKVHCENSGNGCDWTGELGDLQRHLTNKCPYVEAVCKHGCGRKYPRCVLLDHEKDECPSRPIEMKMDTFTQQIMEKLTALETNYEKKLREQEERQSSKERITSRSDEFIPSDRKDKRDTEKGSITSVRSESEVILHIYG